MENNDSAISYFARTNFRNRQTAFGIYQADRLSHMYILGKTGTGKSTLLETLARQDIASGRGLAFLDPHGDTTESLLAFAKSSRPDDLVYFDISNPDYALSFNPLERVAPEKRPLAASGLLEGFKNLWADSWGPRTEHLLRNTLLALLDLPEATLSDIPRILSEPAFRKAAIPFIANAHVRHFWLKEYESYPPRLRADVIAPVQNKVGAFLSNPLLSRVFAQPRSSFDLRQIMDEGKILLVNLSKGKIGSDTSSLLGAFLVSRVSLSAMSRADEPEAQRHNFFLYLDEFHTFATQSMASMLSELRKFRVGLILSHQHTTQLEPPIRDAIFGNVGTTIAFRTGFAEARLLEQEFFPIFSAADFINLPRYGIYLKLMIEGRVSSPFSAQTLSVQDIDLA